MSFPHYVKMAQVAESGCLDCLFFQDTAAVNGSANLDGAGPWRTFFSVYAPLATPGLAIVEKHERTIAYLYPVIQRCPRRHGGPPGAG